MKENNRPEYAYAGDIICEARFWYPMSKAKYCIYTNARRIRQYNIKNEASFDGRYQVNRDFK